MIRVLICDDQSLIRDGLEMLLSLEKNFAVMGKASDGSEALDLVEKDAPDLVLMDLNMPVMNGVEATRKICSRFPHVRVLILTTYDDDEWLFDAIRAGASGYLLKDTPREEVIRAVRGTADGQSFIDPSIAGKLMTQFSGRGGKAPSLITNKLTERETELLVFLAKGLNNREIAEAVFLSEGTVRNHISSIFSKLAVSDRTQAAIIAIEHGLGGT